MTMNHINNYGDPAPPSSKGPSTKLDVDAPPAEDIPAELQHKAADKTWTQQGFLDDLNDAIDKDLVNRNTFTEYEFREFLPLYQGEFETEEARREYALKMQPLAEQFAERIDPYTPIVIKCHDMADITLPSVYARPEALTNDNQGVVIQAIDLLKRSAVEKDPLRDCSDQAVQSVMSVLHTDENKESRLRNGISYIQQLAVLQERAKIQGQGQASQSATAPNTQAKMEPSNVQISEDSDDEFMDMPDL